MERKLQDWQLRLNLEEGDLCAGEHREMKVALMMLVLCVQERFGEVWGVFCIFVIGQWR